MPVRRPLLLLLTATLLATQVGAPPNPDGYQPVRVARGDSARGRSLQPVAGTAATPALISLWGLPPVPGTVSPSGGSLVFQPAGEGELAVLPLFRSSGLGSARHPSVRLLEVAGGDAEPVFLFHLGGAVIETSAPGMNRTQTFSWSLLAVTPEQIKVEQETSDPPRLERITYRIDSADKLTILSGAMTGSSIVRVR